MIFFRVTRKREKVFVYVKQKETIKGHKDMVCKTHYQHENNQSCSISNSISKASNSNDLISLLMLNGNSLVRLVMILDKIHSIVIQAKKEIENVLIYFCSCRDHQSDNRKYIPSKTFTYSLHVIYSLIFVLLPLIFTSTCDWCKYIHLVVKVKQDLLIKHTSKFRRKTSLKDILILTTIKSFKSRSRGLFLNCY